MEKMIHAYDRRNYFCFKIHNSIRFFGFKPLPQVFSSINNHALNPEPPRQFFRHLPVVLGLLVSRMHECSMHEAFLNGKDLAILGYTAKTPNTIRRSILLLERSLAIIFLSPSSRQAF